MARPHAMNKLKLIFHLFMEPHIVNNSVQVIFKENEANIFI